MCRVWYIMIHKIQALSGAPMSLPDSEGAKWWYCSQYWYQSWMNPSLHILTRGLSHLHSARIRYLHPPHYVGRLELLSSLPAKCPSKECCEHCAVSCVIFQKTIGHECLRLIWICQMWGKILDKLVRVNKLPVFVRLGKIKTAKNRRSRNIKFETSAAIRGY